MAEQIADGEGEARGGRPARAAHAGDTWTIS